MCETERVKLIWPNKSYKGNMTFSLGLPIREAGSLI